MQTTDLQQLREFLVVVVKCNFHGDIRVPGSRVNEQNGSVDQRAVANEVKEVGRDGEIHARLCDVREAVVPVGSVNRFPTHNLDTVMRQVDLAVVHERGVARVDDAPELVNMLCRQ